MWKGATLKHGTAGSAASVTSMIMFREFNTLEPTFLLNL